MTARDDAGAAWTIRRRLAVILVAAGVVVLVATTLAVGAFMRTTARTDELVEEVGPARVASYQLLGALLDQESGVRGYALARQDAFLTPYRSGLAAQPRLLARLRTLVGDRPELAADLDTITTAAARWRTEFAEPTVAATRTGAATPDGALGKQLFDAFRAALGTFQADLDASRAAVRGELATATRILQVVGLGALLGALLTAVAVWIALRTWVLAPLDHVRRQARHVVDGQLDRPVRPAGPREVRELAVDVEAMRGYLVAALGTAVHAQATLREQADRLEEQAADLSRSNAELEQFAYVASHDLQEPLRKVASFCQMLERRYSGQLDERGEQYIAFAVDGAKRMQRLINDLLAFSRVGRTTGEFDDVDLSAVLDRALASLATAIEESGAVVTADPLPTVRGNFSLLTQVFQNLVGNAVKFRDEAPPAVRLTVRREGGEWAFACADDGIGIEPRYAERVFVIFQRLHGKEAYEGTGIGLAMCRKIVEHHGGRIWLDTERTGGTTVHWTLPVAADVPAESTAVPGDAPAARPAAAPVTAGAPQERSRTAAPLGASPTAAPLGASRTAAPQDRPPTAAPLGASPTGDRT